jgi:hypothetical protein
VARFIRLAGRPDTAEVAIVVADDVQGRGLGRVLLQRLCAAALERGVQRLHCEVLALNEPMRALLRDLVPDGELIDNGTVMVLEFPLPEVPPDQPAESAPRQDPLYRILVLAAQGLVAIRRAVERMAGKNPPEEEK